MDTRPSPQHNAFLIDPGVNASRTIPILSPPVLHPSSSSTTTTTSADSLDPTSAPQVMPPPARTSPESDSNAPLDPAHSERRGSTSLNEPNAAAAAAAAGGGQQPKVVQTAFIHKLYK